MVNTKLDISICGPTSVFHFDPHPDNQLFIAVLYIAIGVFWDGSKAGEPETLASWATTGPRPAIALCTCEAVGFFGLANGQWPMHFTNRKWQLTIKMVI